MLHLCYNENEVLYLTMTKDHKNFSKVADLTVDRIKLKNAESLKFCETNIAKRRWLIPLLRHGCVLRTVFERRRRSTTETMLVDEMKGKKYKNEEKCQNYVIKTCVLNVYQRLFVMCHKE